MTTTSATTLRTRLTAALKRFDLGASIRDHRYHVELDALCDTCWTKVQADNAARRFWQSETWAGLCVACEDLMEFLSAEDDSSPYPTAAGGLCSGDVVWSPERRTYFIDGQVQA